MWVSNQLCLQCCIDYSFCIILCNSYNSWIEMWKHPTINLIFFKIHFTSLINECLIQTFNQSLLPEAKVQSQSANSVVLYHKKKSWSLPTISDPVINQSWLYLIGCFSPLMKMKQPTPLLVLYFNYRIPKTTRGIECLTICRTCIFHLMRRKVIIADGLPVLWPWGRNSYPGNGWA